VRLACGTSGQAVRFTTLAASGQAFSPAIRTGLAAVGPPGTC
jgi:hypothetical protein